MLIRFFQRPLAPSNFRLEKTQLYNFSASKSGSVRNGMRYYRGHQANQPKHIFSLKIDIDQSVFHLVLHVSFKPSSALVIPQKSKRREPKEDNNVPIFPEEQNSDAEF